MKEQKNILNNNRLNTDKSLKYERNKTDNYLDIESKNVESDSDDIVHSNRLFADKKLQESRAKADLIKDQSSQKTPLLDAERKRSDLAKTVAREDEDKVRSEERDQKKQIAQNLLNSERTDTDNNLHCERVGSDEASQKSSTMVVTAQEALTTRDSYLGILSHDLKNPLSAISLTNSAMKRSFAKAECDKETMNKYFETIERNVQIMGRMINDLLDVEQMINGELRLTVVKQCLNDVINECHDLFKPIALSKTFEIKVTPIDGNLSASFDHDRILQVLSNLVGNALKYSDQSGTITLSACESAGNISISVQDEGPGIPNEKLKVIFERFSQLNKNDHRGAGLGLFISKWIMEAHKGSISVESSAGKGSKFTINLSV